MLPIMKMTPHQLIPVSGSNYLVLLRGAIVNRTYGTHKNVHIYLFFFNNIWSYLPVWSLVIEQFFFGSGKGYKCWRVPCTYSSGPSLVPVCMRQATPPALYVAASGTAAVHCHTGWINPICVKRPHRHYSGQLALLRGAIVKRTKCWYYGGL